jgi:hypothetical protein
MVFICVLLPSCWWLIVLSCGGVLLSAFNMIHVLGAYCRLLIIDSCAGGYGSR